MYNYYSSTATQDVFHDLEDALDIHHVPPPFEEHRHPPAVDVFQIPDAAAHLFALAGQYRQPGTL